ncbi:MAG TPA: PAS domain S-box protein, partial [Roseiflexaceae bacterium]|nr:PAS domain S-box protein [Roseiflexaceae bacterium]
MIAALLDSAAGATLGKAGDFFRELCQVASLGIIAIDRQGRILFSNAALEAMFGYDPGELFGQSVELLMPESMRDAHAAHRAAFETTPRLRPMGFGIDLIGRRKDGSVFPVEASLSYGKTSDQQISVAFVADLSVRKQVEQQLRDSEQRFRLLAVNSPDLIYIFDVAAHASAYFNRDSFLGYSLAELTGPGSITSAIHPDDQAMVRESWQARMHSQAEAADSAEYRVRSKTGAWEWVQSRSVTLGRAADGTPKEILVTLSVITARKQAEETHAYLAALVESSDAAIYSLAPDGTIVSWNNGAEHIYGYRSAEALGRSIALIAPPERRMETEELIQRVHRGERIVHHETVRQRNDGRLIDVALTISPIVNARGQLVGISTIARDISERKRADQQLQRQTAFTRLL